MRETIVVETVKHQETILQTPFLGKTQIGGALDQAVEQIRCNMKCFGEGFPTPATKKNRYEVMDNTEWTNGFWTGTLWLAHEYTGDMEFRRRAEQQVDSFLDRVERRIELDHHDLGFLYSLSCVSAYKLTGSEKGKKAGILAADKLMERYQEKHGFIQAWGELGKKEHYRLIIDCMLNIPLLYWATEVTGDDTYQKAATRHFELSTEYVIRDDASSFHTFYFDPETGKPDRGVTRQGYRDDSSWARGQAWGIYGIPLNYRYTKNPAAFSLYRGMTAYFLNRLPEDFVCYWDLIFGDGSGQSRDSSAAAVAVCGMHEMNKYLPEITEEKELFHHAMHRMLNSLMENYTTDQVREGQPLLLHGVYSWHSGKGVDEGNVWGDYFYMEALMRFWKDWNLYW